MQAQAVQRQPRDRWTEPGHVETEKCELAGSLRITPVCQGSRIGFSALFFWFEFFEAHSHAAYVALDFSEAKTSLESLILLPPFSECWN